MKHLRFALVLFTLAHGVFGCSSDEPKAANNLPSNNTEMDTSVEDALQTVDMTVSADTSVEVDLGGSDQGADEGSEIDMAMDFEHLPPDAAGTQTFNEVTDNVMRGNRTTPVVALVPDVYVGVVLFFPGFQVQSSRYRALGEYIASHGYVVVLGDPEGSLLNADHQAMADDAAAVAAWAETEFGDGPLAVSGHSLGGKLTAMIAQQVGANAYFGIDPVNGNSPLGGGYTAQFPDARIPFANFTGEVGLIGELTNATGGFQPCAPEAQNYQTVYDAATTSAIEWTYDGADHMDFVSDTAGCNVCNLCEDGSADAMAVQDATATLFVAFLQQNLNQVDRSTYLMTDDPAIEIREK